MSRTDIELTGHGGRLRGSRWSGAQASWVAVLVHGYGEHIRRYDWVADRLSRAGAVVYGADHLGHGESDGERVLIADFEPVVEDVRGVVQRARQENPGLPVVLIGHSMGGMIAARYAQRFADDLAGVVLSGPVIGRWDAVERLLAVDVIPDDPIDPSTLSRDEAVGEAYEADPLVWHGAFKRPTVQALVDEITLIQESGSIRVPVLWLHGEDDRLVPIAGSEAGWRVIGADAGRAKRYPGARHEIFNETNKDEVLDDLLSFVRERLG